MIDYPSSSYLERSRILGAFRGGLLGILVSVFVLISGITNASAEVRALWAIYTSSSPSYYSSPSAACSALKEWSAPLRPGGAWAVRLSANVYECNWCEECRPLFHKGEAPTFRYCVDTETNKINFNYRIVEPGICKQRSQPPQNLCSADTPNPVVSNPVEVSTGTKVAFSTDYETADGLFKVSRTYRSDLGKVPDKNTEMVPIGLGHNWRFNFSWDLKLHQYFDQGYSFYRRFALVKPSGATYLMQVSNNGAISSYSDYGTRSEKDLKITILSPSIFDPTAIFNLPHQFEILDGDGKAIVIETYADKKGKYTRGRVKQITYPSGYTWTFTYSSGPILEKITDSIGRQMNFEWVSFAYPEESVKSSYSVKSIAFPDGSKIKYNYDDPGRVEGKSYERLKKTEIEDSSGNVIDSTTYHFEDQYLVYALTGITGHDGVRYGTYSYDSQGRVLTSLHAGNADKTTFRYEKESSTSYKTIVTNALGKETIYAYKATNGVLRLDSIDGVASTNCVGSNKKFKYSYNNSLLEMTDEEGRVTRYKRDAYNRPIEIRHAHGTSEEQLVALTWNDNFHKIASVTTPALKTDYNYDTRGALVGISKTDLTSHSVPYSTSGDVRSWSFSYTPEGLLDIVDGPLAGSSDQINYDYDNNGNLDQVTNELGHVTDIVSVNGRGQPTQIVDASGLTTNLSYDGNGRLTSTVMDPAGIAATYQIDYDAIGQITKITNPDNSYLAYSYNDARRLTKVTNAAGESINYSHDLMGNITKSEIKQSNGSITYSQQRTYDELGRLLKTIGAGSREWKFAYNKLGEEVQVTDPRNKSWTTSYDALGRIISETDPGNSSVTRTYDAGDNLATYTDPGSIVTTFVHNGFGEAIQESSGDIGTNVYQRDARGLITQKTDGRGVVTNYGYDQAGRLLTISYPASTAENVAYNYDNVANGNKGKGRLTGFTDQSGSTNYVYDLLGRIISHTRVIGSTSYTTGYAYDASGKISHITYPSGRIIRYIRDSKGDVTDIKSKVNASAAETTVAYEVSRTPFGSVKYIHYGNNTALGRFFDSNGDMSSWLVEQYGPYQQLLKRDYYYQDKKNLTLIKEPSNTAAKEIYWYDSRNRLQNGEGPWGAYQYYYDGTGNRKQRILKQNGTTVSSENFWYQTGVSNKLNSTSLNGAPERTFTHDGAGNMLTDTKNGVATSYSYNHANRLVSVTIGGTAKGSYLYNANHQLVSRTVQNTSPSGTTHYIHDLNGNLIAEATSSGVAVRDYVWLEHSAGGEGEESGAATPVAIFADLDTGTPKIYYVSADHLDRPYLMTDASKEIVWKATYLPFGGVHQITGSAANDNRFPGQYYQIESGLNYNWHRHYDPSLARYIQPDPLGLIDGPSRYAYVNSNPLQAIDPRGEQSSAAIMGSRAGFAGICAAADGPLPIGDAVGAAILGYTAVELGWQYFIHENRDGYSGHGENPEGKTGKGASWNKHSGKRSGKIYGQSKNKNKGSKNKKYVRPSNPNKR